MRFLPGHLYNDITIIPYHILIIRLAETGFLYSVRRFPPGYLPVLSLPHSTTAKPLCDTAFCYNETPCETAFRFNETAGLWPGGNRIEKIAGKS